MNSTISLKNSATNKMQLSNKADLIRSLINLLITKNAARLNMKMIRNEMAGSRNPIESAALIFCELVLIIKRRIMLSG